MNKKLWAGAAALLLVGAPALAENWRVSSRAGGAIRYIDTDSISRSGDKVTYRSDLRYSTVRTFPSGDRYDRIGSHSEVDCRAMTTRELRGNVALGNEVLAEFTEPGAVEPVPPNTTMSRDLRSVCFNEWHP